MSQTAGFNPRPSLLTDESTPTKPCTRKPPTFQSTSVIADGRIRRSSQLRLVAEVFQSTSVIADGRIGITTRGMQRISSGFNPRPSLLTDESLVDDQLTISFAVFQSTSVIADGRIEEWRKIIATDMRFNPRPSLLTDESAVGWRVHDRIYVSIHVRHC